MESENQENAAIALILLFKKKQEKNEELKKKSRKKRSYKVRPINRNRLVHGFFNSYFLEMKNKDPVQFFKYTRMNVCVFNFLLTKVAPLIEKDPARHPIVPEERLAISLHFLSQGSSMQSIAWKYNIGISTVHVIVSETLEAICLVLEREYLKVPSNEETWNSIADGFLSRWDFPHCIGALDGKHIAMKAPKNEGSQYFNYKKYHSIVLMASCDSDYKFVIIDIGGYGSVSDGGIWQDCLFGQKFNASKMNVPKPKRIAGAAFNVNIPYTFVADAAFPLKHYILRPYPGQLLPSIEENFNKRLSRARTVIENAFGILSSRWRILLQTINADVALVEKITKSVVLLHNFLKTEIPLQYCPKNYVDQGGFSNGEWRKEILSEKMLKSISKLGSNNYDANVRATRDSLAFYLSTEGKL